MLLHALNAYYQRLAADPESGVAPFGYSRQQISFFVVLNADGTLHAIQDARIQDDKGKLRNKSLVVTGNAKSPGAGINPGFLWDNPAYALGFKPDDPKPERTRESFEAFRDRHLAAEDEIGDEPFSAVCRFLESWDPAQAGEHELLAELKTGFGVFQLRNTTGYVHDRPAVRNWWDIQIANADDTAGVGQCLVTGETAPIARLHEPKIKGVWGGQSSGALLVSYNCEAFESYGKDQSFNGPVAERVAFQYTTALNRLLDPALKRRLSVGDTTVVYWTEKPTEGEAWIAELFNPSQSAQDHAEDDAEVNRVGGLLDKIARGDFPGEFGDPGTPFYVLGLSPNAARVSVRFWLESTLGDFLENLGRHYRDLEIDGLSGHPSPFRITAALVREPKDLPPSIAGDLMKSILSRTRYPSTLLTSVIRRLRVEGDVKPVRAGILKAYLSRNEGVNMEGYLNREHASPAYHCGRLFAVLAFAQSEALGSVNASVVRRTMGSVMASPGLTLGRLQKNAEIGHIPKLEKLGQFIHDELKSINVALKSELPRTLDASGQAVFALGYYQQLQNLEFVGTQVRSGRRQRSSLGEWMRSKLEIKFSECLTKAGVVYIYEPSVRLPGDSRDRWPDFVVRGDKPANDWYLEVMGYPGEEYEERRKKKAAGYAKLGISTGGGPKGRLVELDFRDKQYDDRIALDMLRESGFPLSSEAPNE